MKNCKNCLKEYANKRESSMFCSDKCRVSYNRKNPKQKDEVSPIQMQVLYNALMGAVEVINKFSVDLPADYRNVKNVGILKPNGEIGPLSFDKLKDEAENKPTYLQLLNQMPAVMFSDEKEDYARKIQEATHLPQDQRNKLIEVLKYR